MDITPAFVSRLVQQKQSWGSSKGKVERDACARRSLRDPAWLGRPVLIQFPPLANYRGQR